MISKLIRWLNDSKIDLVTNVSVLNKLLFLIYNEDDCSWLFSLSFTLVSLIQQFSFISLFLFLSLFHEKFSHLNWYRPCLIYKNCKKIKKNYFVIKSINFSMKVTYERLQPKTWPMF